MGEWIITAQPGTEDEVYEFVDPKPAEQYHYQKNSMKWT